jgi:hypothetical protein
MTIRHTPMVVKKHQGFAYDQHIHNHYTQEIQQ